MFPKEFNHCMNEWFAIYSNAGNDEYMEKSNEFVSGKSWWCLRDQQQYSIFEDIMDAPMIWNVQKEVIFFGFNEMRNIAHNIKQNYVSSLPICMKNDKRTK